MFISILERFNSLMKMQSKILKLFKKKFLKIK